LPAHRLFIEDFGTSYDIYNLGIGFSSGGSSPITEVFQHQAITDCIGCSLHLLGSEYNPYYDNQVVSSGVITIPAGDEYGIIRAWPNSIAPVTAMSRNTSTCPVFRGVNVFTSGLAQVNVGSAAEFPAGAAVNSSNLSITGVEGAGNVTYTGGRIASVVLTGCAHITDFGSYQYMGYQRIGRLAFEADDRFVSIKNLSSDPINVACSMEFAFAV
jgi:hypothetical protein